MRTLLYLAGIVSILVGAMGITHMRSDIQLTIGIVGISSGIIMFGVAHAIGIAARIERSLLRPSDPKASSERLEPTL